MKKTSKILFLITLFTLLSCNESYNKIEITFLKSNLKDTIPIKFSLFKIASKDSVIFNKEIMHIIKINKNYVFDSLPDGDYILEYSDIKDATITKKISLRNNNTYKSKIIFDSLPLEKYYNLTPIYNLKDGEKYKLLTWGGCVARMESCYIVTKIKDKYVLQSYGDNKRVLKKDEIKAIKKFEAELLALNGKGSCSSTGRMTYSISKNNVTDTLFEDTCNWNSYSLLMNKLFNSN